MWMRGHVLHFHSFEKRSYRIYKNISIPLRFANNILVLHENKETYFSRILRIKINESSNTVSNNLLFLSNYNIFWICNALHILEIPFGYTVSINFVNIIKICYACNVFSFYKMETRNGESTEQD